VKKVLVSLIIVAFLYPCLVLGIENRNIVGKISFGYDDNIFEQAESKTGRSFLRLYLDSSLPLLQKKRLGSVLRLQDGFKIVGKEENVAINQVNLRLAFLISPKITSEFQNELKHKNISDCQNSSSLSEDGYLNWNSGVSLKFKLRNFLSDIRCFERRLDYADSDFFDANIRQIQVVTNVKLPRRLIGNFIADWQHSHFPQSLLPELNPAQPLAQPEGEPQTRVDNLYEISVGLQWVERILINPNYTFQRNKSNSNEYSFRAHQFSILTASPFFWEVTMQLYGRIQLRQYDSQEMPPFQRPDEDNIEQARNVLIFNLAKDIFRNCSLEARYLLSQAELPLSSMRYTKQSYSLTVSYSF